MARKARKTRKDMDPRNTDLEGKETPTSLPVDPKTGKEIPAPKEVPGDTPVPDSDDFPFMIGTSIYTGGERE